jgi:hypothetical protein
MVYIRKMGAEKTCPKIIRARPLFLEEQQAALKALGAVESMPVSKS